MYWINLIILTFAIYVPTMIKHGNSLLGMEQLQELALLFFCGGSFVIFLVMERRMNRISEERGKLQKQLNSMTKDLRNSYSYIGETNRKLDILEHIAIGYPENSIPQKRNGSEFFQSIMGAIQVFGKSDAFVLRFIQKQNLEVIKEIKSYPEFKCNFLLEDYSENKTYWEKDSFIVITSPKAIDNIFACLVIKKNQANKQIEDEEMMKTLVAQALFLFMFMKKKKQIECVI